jgi:DeoR family ulaG and ulaABCDEF operon transcriptional repressor
VLTNSLHIVSALLAQSGTRVLVPGGAVFREQSIILSAGGDDLMPPFHAPKLFMGAASVGPRGIMQADIVLVAAERRLIDRAEQLILLVDSSKFRGPSGNVVCGLEEIDVVVTRCGYRARSPRGPRGGRSSSRHRLSGQRALQLRHSREINPSDSRN